MSDDIPRLRMFAEPNGSGKTTVKNRLGKPESWFGLYINPDELQAGIQRTGMLAVEQLGMNIDMDKVRVFSPNQLS
jgi:predicted ABC-type ATPase